MLHQRNLKTLSLGRDKKVRADKLFEVFRTDNKDRTSTKGVRASSASNSQGKLQEAECSSWTLADQSGSDEDLGFTEDTLADPAVVQEMQKAKQPIMPALTKEEAEEAAETWRVEGSSRAGFKVFRRVKEEEVQSSQGSEQSRELRSKKRRRKRSRSRRRRSRRDPFPDL
eukprot:s230_g6.t1